jgi:hypothetical protein
MKTIFVALLGLAVFVAPFAWAQEDPAPVLADEDAEGKNRDCALPDKSCQKREVQRPATYPSPSQVHQQVDKLTGTATKPADAPAAGSTKSAK